MIVKIVIEGVLLGALLALLCAVGIRKGAVTMVFLYHGDVQDRCVQNGLITRERIWQNRKIFKGLGIPLYKKWSASAYRQKTHGGHPCAICQWFYAVIFCNFSFAFIV